MRIHFHTTHTRDAALQRLARLNRWLIAGSVALTGVLSAVAANAFPGKTLPSSAANKAKRAAHSRSEAGSATTPSTSTPETLHPPEQAPQAAEPSQAAPPQESSQAAPQQESAPAQEAPPAQESSEPVTSGAS